ncbi:interleukin-1 receptor type 1 [Otolemur garnettii]|uniref:Interleukin-1 receptor type 1 n=1 Tax=Otolemur garnettii TaxID=30611 RepID=H0WXK9_OTOGA|nr:interleukin-1 receptor type 1 [Otolemur garnettii]XP_023371598.1 interleukin-1 receptor type 1 [Otolemur garnettii]XP_023371599.1 interleukin-1 receptor type 1 [Otolemur garnettii]XP_023371600.1 interleukin-1 receptor type 1 [Otolemur garnettii]XP_023371601.1 interleukin-1 receptor type 1 [Otolemur garnettii]XP_023371602.1 interleukin-1 receptor type 1 [Otolemur garnettii]XP_023371603.1 interleukin-1 receptor type 1 [Otolemur garnettii]XP_023371604.1 interleukin-1 receptor type 1 [Otolemu
MKVLLGLFCFIALLIFSLEADECQEREETINRVSSANEIDVRSCPLNPDEKKGDDIIWYKNDSETPISTSQDSRIHQHKNQLWFVPAKVEDSGHYYCAVRDSSSCFKIKISPKFVENEPNTCYNAEAMFVQKLPLEQDGNLVCPHLDFFKDENNEFPKTQWYKNCQPLLLDNTHFGGATNQLIVKNVAEEHRGNYTCRASYTYLGKQHSVTRVIAFVTTNEANKTLRPVIWSPANETIEVEPGSQMQLICNVTAHPNTFVFWKWNGSEAEDVSVLEEEYHIAENPSDRRRSTLITVLNISEVESRFYLHPFICLARGANDLNVAYIQLIRPVPDFKNHVIGVFVLLTVIITCSVFIYKIFKIDIVLWYRDSCYIFLPPKASDGKTYDAYILYPKTLGEGSTSYSDIFVFKVLPEVLEKQCGYKLFIYGRDDYVGEDIVEVINENIKKCRRLIIILVREMSSFGWLGSSSEEQIAMYNALIQDGMKVVLLELEKIQDYEKMPESIQFIKRKHGAIRWSGDYAEGPQSVKTRFWKSVRYHMPDQRRPSSAKHQLLSLATRPDSKERLQREAHLPLG